MKKNNKTNKIIILSIIGLILIVSLIIFILNYTKDSSSFSILEKNWLNNHKSNVIDVSVYNDIPVYGQDGNGIIFSYLEEFTNAYGIEFNKVSYLSTGSVNNKDVTFRILNYNDELSDKDIEMYKDYYVVVSSKEDSLNGINDLIDKNVGILDGDITNIRYYLNDGNGIKFTTCKDIDELLEGMTNESISYMVIPYNLYLDDILKNDMHVVYHINDLYKKYVLTINGDKTLKSIMNKFMMIYQKDYYEEDYNRVVGLYNSQQQNKYQNRLDKNDFKKYSFTEKVTEFFGKPYQLIVTMKKSKLKRLAKKLDQEDITSEEKLDVRDEIEKINNEISASDVISSVKLFNAKNKLSDMKLKLYKGEQLDYSKVTNTISKVLGKGLSKKKDDLDILNNKSRAITVMDQYVELVASGSFSKEDIDAAYDYLEKIGSLLTNSEYNGYLEELNLIYYYRSLNKIPYHLNQIGNKTEVDDLIKYYDSEEYSKLLNKNASYIKGK